MSTVQLPYGRQALHATLPALWQVDQLAPAAATPVSDPLAAVTAALRQPLGFTWEAAATARSVAIAINDKTRPVPHQYLLPPLLERLHALGLPPEAITFLIATGTHAPMAPAEFAAILPPEILRTYRVLSHDADDRAALVFLGTSARGTPLWINRHFVEAELRIVVGNLEPHQFAGYSGGVKTAVIGLGGRETINANHALQFEPGAQPARYDDNPVRQDIEELGRKVGVHLALNAILEGHKQIVAVIAGDPVAVMRAGIPLAARLYVVPVGAPYDLVIASPGGHPKDLNLYQAQKALAHAALAVREGGALILVAACPEGTGSASYERWMLEEAPASYAEVAAKFWRDGFRVGPHKALLVARDAARARTVLVSELAPDLVRRLLLTPAADLAEALALVAPGLPPAPRVAVMPAANATVPQLKVAGL